MICSLEDAEGGRGRASRYRRKGRGRKEGDGCMRGFEGISWRWLGESDRPSARVCRRKLFQMLLSVPAASNTNNPGMARDLKSAIFDDSHIELHLDGPRVLSSRFLHRRRKFVIGFALATLALLVPTCLYFSRTPLLVSQDTVLLSPGISRWDRMSALLGSPTDRFRGSSTSR
jgi:hypothetical protein